MNLELNKKIKSEFQLWLAQWSDIPWVKNHNHVIYMNLYNVYKFANNYIKLNDFLENHGWKVEDWIEVDYLVRDVELTDKLLLRLPAKIRRNLLAAIQHYKKGQLAGNLNCAKGLVTLIFDYENEADSKEYFLLPLARFLDAPYWAIRYDSYELDSRKHDEYVNVKAISFKEFISEINIDPGNIKFFKIKRSQEYFISPPENNIYVKVSSFSNFKIIETMGLNYGNEEKYDFINCGIRDEVVCIIVTPAILRKTKKVIYVLKSRGTEESEEMIRFISSMDHRKFTRIYEANSGGSYFKKMKS